MTAKSNIRGRSIEYLEGYWVFSDTKELVKEKYTPDLAGSGQYLRCASCGLGATSEGYDGCLGELPKEIVMNACCGHGSCDDAYIQYWDGHIVRGKEAKAEQVRLMTD